MKGIKVTCNLRKWGSRFRNEIFNFLFAIYELVMNDSNVNIIKEILRIVILLFKYLKSRRQEK